MTVLARLTAALFIASGILSTVSATAVESRTYGQGGQGGHGQVGHGGGQGGGKDCGKNEFWFSKGSKSCCVGKPPASPPKPPSGHQCPPNYWWKQGDEFCAPPTPPGDDDDDEPECPSGCKWNHDDQYCQPHTPPPQPSGHYGHGGHGGHGGKGKRDLKSRAASLCPQGLSACPIQGLTAGEYECLDTQAELESCGGCTSLGQGQDCTAIPGAWNVGCELGTCAVYTCASGFTRSADGKSCIAL